MRMVSPLGIPATCTFPAAAHTHTCVQQPFLLRPIEMGCTLEPGRGLPWSSVQPPTTKLLRVALRPHACCDDGPWGYWQMLHAS